MTEPAEDARIAYTAEEVAKLLGVGRATVYEAIRRGQLPHITLGRRILIPKAAFGAWLAGKKDMP